jgi:hypothetical protein
VSHKVAFTDALQFWSSALTTLNLFAVRIACSVTPYFLRAALLFTRYVLLCGHTSVSSFHAY